MLMGTGTGTRIEKKLITKSPNHNQQETTKWPESINKKLLIKDTRVPPILNSILSVSTAQISATIDSDSAKNGTD